MVADAGTTAARARSGVTGLVKTAGRTNLARAPGGISLARTALRAMPVFLRCLHHQEGMKITTRTRGLADSRSLETSPTSWAELRPQRLSVSSSSLFAR